MQTLVRALLWLYPDYWRARYGEEFAALLESCPLRLTTILDMLLGALDAYIAPQDTTGRIMRTMNRPRRSAIVVFCAYIAFVLAGLNFFGSSEDDVHRLTSAHADIAAAYFAVQVGAGLALLSVLTGGVPVALAVLWRAWEQRRWDIPLLFAVPPVAMAVWIGWTAIIVLVIAPASSRARAGGMGAGLVFFSWGGLFLLAAIASTAAVSIAVSRSALDARVFRFALWSAALATALMAGVLGGVVFWGLAVHRDVPAYFNTGITPLRFPYLIAWAADVAVMGAATLVAAWALVRGLRGPSVTQVMDDAVDAA